MPPMVLRILPVVGIAFAFELGVASHLPATSLTLPLACSAEPSSRSLSMVALLLIVDVAIEIDDTNKHSLPPHSSFGEQSCARTNMKNGIERSRPEGDTGFAPVSLHYHLGRKPAGTQPARAGSALFRISSGEFSVGVPSHAPAESFLRLDAVTVSGTK